MANHPDEDVLRLNLASEVAASWYARLASNVIEQIRLLPRTTRRLDGRDHAGLADLWEEYKYLFQCDYSTYTDYYEHVVLPLCHTAVQALELESQQFLWLWATSFEESCIQSDTITLNDFDLNAVIGHLYQCILDTANNERLVYDPDQEQANDYPPGG